MADTPAMVEAKIVAKEIELLKEYETHQGRPLASNPFWVVRILLSYDIQEKEQWVHSIKEALALIRRGL